MSIGSTNYQQPVQVNGFTCHNCTEVDEAKKHIDPAHPKSGPYGIDAKTDPTQKKSAITFGGSLTGTSASSGTSSSTASGSTPSSSTTSSSASGATSTATAAQTTAQATAPGQSVNILA